MTKIHPTCSCGVDIHAHIIPKDFPAYMGSSMPSGWPSMAPADECHRHVMIDGKNYRTVSDKSWTPANRWVDMQAMGLQLQAISPMPELLSYWLPASDGTQLVRYLNDQIASMVNESNGSLVGLGAVPLQDIDRSIRELRYLKEDLDFAGVEIGSNINGVVVGDPMLDPFFEACEAMSMSVFVHALRPTGMDRLVGPAPLQQILAYPSDVGLAAASAITSNLLIRRPKLRIAFSHGGGTLASLLPRLAQSALVFPGMKDLMPMAPVDQARLFFYDSLVFDRSTLVHLIEKFGIDQLMIGTDYPFNFHDDHPVDRILQLGLSEKNQMQLIRDNAMRFLGLEH